MIKVFGKIRQSLLKENKFSKYLLYAIGEIILVVIGILIALGINNIQEDQIKKKKEQTYLKGLQEEFQTSKLKLKELMTVNQRNFEGATQLLYYISENDSIPTEKEFSELLFNSFSSEISFNPNNSLLIEIINSGSLKDISNTKLRIQLTNWISTIEDITRQENELGVQREKVLDIFRTNHNSLRTIFNLSGVTRQLGLPEGTTYTSNLDLLHSRAFENNLLMFTLTSSAMETAHYEPLMQSINTILGMIQKEIKD